jgi:hypothetical protein
MQQLGARPIPTRVDPSDEMLDTLERTLRVVLPADYSAFIARHGAMQVNATLSFLEPTPLGTSTSVGRFFGFDPDPKGASDIAWATGIADGQGAAVAIASDLTSKDWYYLDCRDRHRGQVLLCDAQQRHLWTIESAQRRFGRVSLVLRAYFDARDAGTLAPPLSGMPGWYLVGRSFDEFLGRLKAG